MGSVERGECGVTVGHIDQERRWDWTSDPYGDHYKQTRKVRLDVRSEGFRRVNERAFNGITREYLS